MACGTSSAQYVNFTLDGVAQTFNSQAPDSLMAYTVPQQGTTQYSTLVTASHNAAPFGAIYFSFMHPTFSAGTYAATQLSVGTTTGATIVPPFNIVVTNFPQNVGEYYEGTFSGSYIQQSTTHVITNGTFRVRKAF
jgi:hypothetical protein